MDEATFLIFSHLGIALLLGLLVGLQRQHRQSAMAGLRTFPLITVLGTLAATIDHQLQLLGWITAGGLLGLTAIVAMGMRQDAQRANAGQGITTEAAILLMYLLGAYLVVGERVVAIAVGAGVAVLLQFKPELHGLAARLGDKDLRAIMTFALITCIILPVLPNTTYDLVPPLNVLNPFQIWTMVVLMVAISLSGYLAYHLLGRTTGVLLCGLLGGAISSTATTMSFSRRARENAATARLATVVVGIASSVVFLRVLLEIAVVGPQHFPDLAPPLAVMLAASAAAALVAWFRAPGSNESLAEPGNPTELKSALLFAGLYALVLLALAAAKTYLGGHGLYPVAVLSGLTDMDAITLSSLRLTDVDPAQGGLTVSQAWRMIVLAAMANLAFKWGLCCLIGPGPFARAVGLLYTPPFLAGAVLLFAWP